MATGNVVEVERGPDGDIVTVNGVRIPGAWLMTRDALRVVVSIPAASVTIRQATGPQARRIELGDKTYG